MRWANFRAWVDHPQMCAAAAQRKRNGLWSCLALTSLQLLKSRALPYLDTKSRVLWSVLSCAVQTNLCLGCQHDQSRVGASCSAGPQGSQPRHLEMHSQGRSMACFGWHLGRDHRRRSAAGFPGCLLLLQTFSFLPRKWCIGDPLTDCLERAT